MESRDLDINKNIEKKLYKPTQIRKYEFQSNFIGTMVR